MLVSGEEAPFPQAGRAIFFEGLPQEFPNFGPIKYLHLSEKELQTCSAFYFAI